MMNKRAILISAVGILSGVLFSTTAAARHQIEVTVTNLTKGMTFTPALVATTRWNSQFFELGEPASMELGIIAESGNSTPLSDSLDSYDSASLDFIGPGESDSVTLSIRGYYQSVSLASMLIPTNDTFLALNGVNLPWGHRTITKYVTAYDAGTELNDELCASLPGPGCGGDPGPDSDNGEGYIYISNGIRGIGDLDADELDFNNPVAKITITRR